MRIALRLEREREAERLAHLERMSALEEESRQRRLVHDAVRTIEQAYLSILI